MEWRKTALLIGAGILFLGVLVGIAHVVFEPICCGVERIETNASLPTADRSNPILIDNGRLHIDAGNTELIQVSIFAPRDLNARTFTIGSCTGWNGSLSVVSTSEAIEPLRENETIEFEATVAAESGKGKYTCTAELLDQDGEPVLRTQFVTEVR